MGFIRYDAPLNALVVTRGHPFERDAFFAVLDSWRDIACCAVEQPAAQRLLEPEAARGFDAVVFYDMPGIAFRPGQAPELVAPPARTVEGLRALLEEGKGLVFLHHAMAGWPAWDAYAEIVGARFLYAPAEVRGRACPDSGYRHGVTHRVSVEAPGHPVVEGLGEGFEIEDELYLCEIFEDDVVPLLRSDYAFVEDNFYSAARAVEGVLSSREGWSHAPGSNLVAWAKAAGRSPVVTITSGDAPCAYANPAFRRLVGNAIRWVASDEARSWAAEQTGGVRADQRGLDGPRA